MNGPELLGVSRATYARRKLARRSDTRRRMARTPAAMLAVLHDAFGRPATQADDLRMGICADLLLRHNNGELSAADLSQLRRLLVECQVDTDTNEFAEFT